MIEVPNFPGEPVPPNITELLAVLPLERCPIEQNPITGESGWHAPEGLIFDVSGKFTVASYPYVYEYPLESRDLLIAGNQEDYEQALDWMDGDEDEAILRMLEDLDIDHYYGYGKLPPTSFQGKWLIVAPNNHGKMSLMVREEVWATSSSLRMPVYSESLGDGSIPVDSTEYEPKTDVFWSQAYAEPMLGESSVKLIEYDEPAQVIYVPEQQWAAIEIPENRPYKAITREEYFEIYKKYYGIDVPEEQQLEFMRERRLKGDPFGDDPLHDFKLPRQIAKETIILAERPRIIRIPKPEDKKWTERLD